MDGALLAVAIALTLPRDIDHDAGHSGAHLTHC
jgi:hypothetical protein